MTLKELKGGKKYDSRRDVNRERRRKLRVQDG